MSMTFFSVIALNKNSDYDSGNSFAADCEEIFQILCPQTDNLEISKLEKMAWYKQISKNDPNRNRANLAKPKLGFASTE